ncbi:hypothetical protein HDU93_005255 [Gonapodya sp. JEL0774]|nr:hypothetical protein HDU93_005255 [Gonapodya sp. JEL0774]
MKRQRGKGSYDEFEDDEKGESMQVEGGQAGEIVDSFKGRKSESGPSISDEEDRRKEQNRKAQKAWRQRKENQLATLQEQVSQLTEQKAQLLSTNKNLAEMVSTLQTEVRVLREVKSVKMEDNLVLPDNPVDALSAISQQDHQPSKILLVAHADIDKILATLAGRAVDISRCTDGSLGDGNSRIFGGPAAPSGPTTSAYSWSSSVHLSRVNDAPTAVTVQSLGPSPASSLSTSGHERQQFSHPTTVPNGIAKPTTAVGGIDSAGTHAMHEVAPFELTKLPGIKLPMDAGNGYIQKSSREELHTGHDTLMQPRLLGRAPNAASAPSQLAEFGQSSLSGVNMLALAGSKQPRLLPHQVDIPEGRSWSGRGALTPPPTGPTLTTRPVFSPLPPKQSKSSGVPRYTHDHIDQRYDYSNFPSWQTFNPTILDMFDFLAPQVATPEIVAAVNNGNVPEYALVESREVSPLDIISHDTLPVPIALDLMDRFDPRQLFVPQPMADIFLDPGFTALLETACPCPVLKAKFLFLREFLMNNAHADPLNEHEVRIIGDLFEYTSQPRRLLQEALLCECLSRKREVLEVNEIAVETSQLAAIAAGAVATPQTGDMGRKAAWAVSPLARETALGIMRTSLGRLLQGERGEIIDVFRKLFPTAV